MKDAKGHGSNGRGAQGKTVFYRGGMRDPATMGENSKRTSLQADDKAASVMDKIENGIHSGQINSLPALQKRHYYNIATTLAEQGKTADPAEHSRRVTEYANRLSTTNPQFNRQRFIEAASGKR